MYKKLLNQNFKLQQYAHKIIPGLSGLLGKRPELYVTGGKWPTYYSKSKGINIWDLKGNKFLDFTMLGIGSCVMGYSDPDMNKIAKKIINNGSMTTLNPIEDLELAERLIDIHPWAEQVKYARTGGEIMSMAVRIARAATGRDKVLFCGYHGWHDWYLSTNLNKDDKLKDHLLPGLEPMGVPKNLQGSVLPFRFNNYDDLNNIVFKNAKECAAIIIEPAREKIVDKKFLSMLRKISTKNNCVLIFDEITCAWRNETCGIHKEIGVNPDLITFGKTIANGIPMAVLMGKRSIMEYANKTFISSTNWTERLGPACAVEFIKKHKKIKAGKILINNGNKIRNIWKKAADNANLNIDISGILPLSQFKIIHDQWPIIISYFNQEMLKRKILASDRCYSNIRQDEKSLKKYENACFDIFYKISTYLNAEILEKKLDGPVKQMGFKRLT